ncbi:MAG TPA: hypothetical protein VGD13_12850 [Xanthobacteraceae bacterium]|jgi:hypothetical protein
MKSLLLLAGVLSLVPLSHGTLAAGRWVNSPSQQCNVICQVDGQRGMSLGPVAGMQESYLCRAQPGPVGSAPRPGFTLKPDAGKLGCAVYDAAGPQVPDNFECFCD